MWLRSTVAVVALAAILSCGALINGVKEFPGPWALVPVGATMLFILTGANRLADPHTGGKLPFPNRLLATKPFVWLGSIAYSLYLWHWPLLIFWLVYSDRQHAALPRRRGRAAGVGSARVSDHQIRREPPALPVRGRRHRSVGEGSAAHPTAQADDRARLDRGRARGGADRDLVHLARARPRADARTPRTWARWSRSTIPVRTRCSTTPRCRTRRCGRRCWRPRRISPRPPTTAASATSTNVDVISCSYGDKSATHTIALAGGSHAEHWITALDLLGKLHHFKVTTYLKMGCPLTTEDVPLVMGDNRPYPKCHTWNEAVMKKIIADRPDFVFTTATRPWNIKPGDVMPGTYVGIWQTLSDNNIPILAMRDTPWLVRKSQPFFPADCLADGGNGISCGIRRSDVLSATNPTLSGSNRFPLLKPLDMSDAVCRKDVCRAVEGNVLIYHDSHHISKTYMRTMADELGRQIGVATHWW